MSTLKSDILVAGVASGITLAACTALAGPAVDLASQAAEVASSGLPTSSDPATVHGVDVLEVLILGLAALGLGPVARILGLLKPVLTPILRAALGSKTKPLSPPPPSSPSMPEPTS